MLWCMTDCILNREPSRGGRLISETLLLENLESRHK
jgi:hypothetical protein